MFVKAEWNARPPAAANNHGIVVVTRNVEEVERDGIAMYVGEVARMSESAYAAYVGAMEVAAKREQEIVDETILNLVEEGSL